MTRDEVVTLREVYESVADERARAVARLTEARHLLLDIASKCDEAPLNQEPEAVAKRIRAFLGEDEG